MKVNIVEHNKGIRPQIKLRVQRVEANVWEDLSFHVHHYRTKKLNKSSKCFVFYWEDKVVGFCAVLHAPKRNMSNALSISRLVVLPQFHGLNIGSIICNFVGGIFKNEGYKLYIKTVNMAIGNYFNTHTDVWRATVYNQKFRPRNMDESKYRNRIASKSFCHEYCGKEITGYEDMLLSVSEMRKNRQSLNINHNNDMDNLQTESAATMT
ncbi:GNAT family N-acetyltransferase [Bacteroides sp. 51]|uniref:GNAT family N-acetyltransferase n=1 Tax=Bacteroides sp. 51 TaxID=2302938 RepID=UPI0013D0A4B9|nr:GNAT family N-acetyltransferase [Bacteroides sp. 51]NDV83732.1 N-acetyltransferase [Bacteroides sp. 51]